MWRCCGCTIEFRDPLYNYKCLFDGSTAWKIIMEILFGTKVKSFRQPQLGTISHYRSRSRSIRMQNKIGTARGIKGTSWKFAEHHNTAKFLNVRR